MKTSFVSTIGFRQPVRQSIADTQHQLVRAEQELASGRHFDVGLKLGHDAGRVLNTRHEIDRLEALMQTNRTTSTHLETAQFALTALAEGAEGFLSTLLAARQGLSGDVAQTAAQAALTTAQDLLNTSVNGSFVFGGINSGVAPMDSYLADPPSVPKQQIDTSFQSVFGITQSDPAVAGIAAAQMQSFLDNEFAAEFELANWSANWSQSSDHNVTSRITHLTVIETSVNANDEAVRSLVQAYTMVAELGGDAMSQETFTVVADAALAKLGEAMAGVTESQTKLGVAQSRVQEANDRAELRKNILSGSLNDLEAVDPYEVSIRIAGLMAQLETSFALTARLQRLSLNDYL